MLKRVYLEITNSCNLSCSFCTYDKGTRFLSLEEIDDYTSQIKPYCDYIYLHILGEPLLHPSFNKILDILSAKGFKLQLVTNGVLLDRYPDILSHEFLRKLSISLHSINNLNIGQSYFDSIDNLISNNEGTKLELRFYDRNSLSPMLSQYLERLKNDYGFNETVRKNSYMLKENVYIYFEELFKWPSLDNQYIGDSGTCHGAIDMIAISSNSDVTVCCLDPQCQNKIGNLKKDTLKDILHSDAYLRYVDDFRNHRISSPLCQRCSYRLRFGK